MGTKMISSVVTGAAGFIGSNLVDELLARGYRVTGIDNLAVGRRSNLQAALADPNFRFVEADMCDPKALDGVCAGAQSIFHLGALADIVPSIENPGAYYRANVEGTFAVIEAARRHGIARLVYAASSSCYGLAQEFPTPETAPVAPQYPYALTKRLGEELALHWGMVYDIPTVALRFFNVFGPRARTSGTYGAVFGVFLAQKLAGKPFTVVGDGTQTRDFTYVDDVVDAIITAAQSQVRGESINIGSGGSYSINELTALLGGPVEYIPKRPGEPDCTFADIRKARRLLNWEPKIAFTEGVRRLLTQLDAFADAPVWDAASIEKATAAWFEKLDRSVAGTPV